MGEFSNIFKTLRKSNGYTQETLAKALRITRSRLAMYETGSREPDFETLESIADFFNVDIDYLMGRTDKTTLLPESVHSIYGHWKIPVVATVAAGTPIYSDENIEYYIDYDKNPNGHVCGLHIKGDSMEPVISNGSLVIIDEDAEWVNGDIVVVTVNGNDGTCKRIQKIAEGIQLLSINQSYEPIYYSKEDVETLPVRVLGKVVETRRKF